jgi:hypothetical protein
MKTHAATSKSPARATCAVLQAKPAREGARALTPPDYGIDFVDRRLRAGLEAASGMDFSDVRVHRNSPLPAQINALAYTRGNDIHLGPGQERHLAHEAWSSGRGAFRRRCRRRAWASTTIRRSSAKRT